MGYALFAQNKLILCSELISAQLSQTLYSNMQFMLAAQSAGLKQELSSIGAASAGKSSGLYRQLAELNQNKSTQLSGSDGEMTDEEKQEAERVQKQTDSQKAALEAEIKAIEEEVKVETDRVNRELLSVSLKENAVEQEVKRQDTRVTALQEQLEAVQQAEGQGIQNSIPKFSGLG